MLHDISCADPEIFVRGGPLLTSFFLEYESIQIPLNADHHWPASKTPFKWRFPGGLMMAQHFAQH